VTPANGFGQRIRPTDSANGFGQRIRPTDSANGFGQRIRPTDSANGVDGIKHCVVPYGHPGLPRVLEAAAAVPLERPAAAVRVQHPENDQRGGGPYESFRREQARDHAASPGFRSYRVALSRGRGVHRPRRPTGNGSSQRGAIAAPSRRAREMSEPEVGHGIGDIS
jgi:hypothetical protein